MVAPLLSQPRDRWGGANAYQQTGIPDGILDRAINGNGKTITNLRGISTLTRFDVTTFGAYTDGTHSAETIAAVLAAETAARAAGGGIVFFPIGIYDLGDQVFYFDHPCVIWAGEGAGPHYFQEDPATVVQGAAVLLIRNTTAEFLFAAAPQRTFEDLAFVYPDQIPADTAGVVNPVVYPYTLRIEEGDCTVRRCTFYNSYNGIRVRNGRYKIDDVHVLAFHNDIIFERCVDTGQWTNFWSGDTGYLIAAAVEAYLNENKTSVKMQRVDDFHASNIHLGICHKGIEFSANTVDEDAVPGTGGSAYGSFNGLYIDGCTYALDGSSTNTSGGGVRIANFNAGPRAASDGSVARVTAPPAGFLPALITIVGGALRGEWAAGIIDSPQTEAGGKVWMLDVLGYDLPFDFVAPGFLNGWVDNGGGNQAAGFLKERGDWVHLRGVIAGGATADGTIAFLLPEDCRPPLTEVFRVASNNAAAEVQITPDGEVKLYNAGSTYLSLSGIAFRTR